MISIPRVTVLKHDMRNTHPLVWYECRAFMNLRLRTTIRRESLVSDYNNYMNNGLLSECDVAMLFKYLYHA